MNNQIVKTTQITDDSSNLIAMAIEKGAGIDVLERLMNLKERVQKDIAEKAFREAMSRFQGECPIIEKKKIVLNKDGRSTRYKYAPLDDIIRTVQPYLAKNGLSYEIKIEILKDPSAVSATVRAYHELGHSSETNFIAPIDIEAYMNEPQKWASAQTFAKRYAFSNAFGILTGDEDDNAEKAENKSKNDLKEKTKQEALDKLNALPDNIKKGLEILGYDNRNKFDFCSRFEWNYAKILKEINIIIDSKAV